MIKLTGQGAYGRPVLILGLSDENVRRLTGDQPVLIRGHELRSMGLPDIDIAIVHGETEEAILDYFRHLGVQVVDTTEGNADG